MSSKKVFKIKDRVFAKIRGYRAWPAKISGIEGNFSQPRYRVNFYGSGECALCKPEDLFPFEENISKLGENKNKNQRFAEALFQMECDTETPVRKTLPLPIKRSDFKGTKRNISNIELQKPSKKLMSNKIKVSETSLGRKLPSSKNSSLKRKMSVIKHSNKLMRDKIKGRKNFKKSSKKLLGIKIGVLKNLKVHSKKANTINILKDPKLKMIPVVMIEKLPSFLIEKHTSQQVSIIIIFI